MLASLTKECTPTHVTNIAHMGRGNQAEDETRAGGDMLRWRRQVTSLPTGRLDLEKLMDTPDRTAGTFFTYVVSARECDALLLLGSWERIHAWLNGEHILTHKRLDVMVPDLDVVRVHLKTGPNELLVRRERVLNE